MNKLDPKKLALYGLFTALVTVTTMAITIPLIGVQGFVNVGDTMIFFVALMAGAKAGALAGGLGSALADVLLGYTHWAPWTLVIKGLQGLLVGLIGHHSYAEHKQITARSVLSLAAGALWMVIGYYLAGGIQFGFPAALATLPGDALQGGGSIILVLPLLYLFRRRQSSLDI